jgi:hypothetical protein
MRTFKIIISFDADYYSGCSNQEIAEYIAKEAAPIVAKVYKDIPSYIKTSVEVTNTIVVDTPFDDIKEEE